ncbi:MAG: amidohydrolase [Pseudomonadales bacterium]|jgi:predicted amidohydrolase YtcJ|nr:amidohydrolase [Pseudomonadales bacterium]
MRHAGRSAALFLMGVLLAACDGAADPSGPETLEPADAIWSGGVILTMNDAQPEAEALAVRDGRILAVGDRDRIETAHLGPETRRIDLQGHTLLPGFVDAHSHFSFVAIQAVAANLLPPPDGPVNAIEELQAVLRSSIETSPLVAETGVVIGFDYDDSQLAEQRHPDRHDLDAVSTELPILLIHQSGHLGVYNSLALARAGITAETPDPPGGTIHRDADGVPTGLMDENAHFAALGANLPRFTAEQMHRMLGEAQLLYAANGFTTVQDGRTDPGGLVVLENAADAGVFELDVVAYPDLEMNADNPALAGPRMSRDYRDHFRLGGVKLTLDGSPQGKTAWFTAPYLEPPAGAPADYAGAALLSDEAAGAIVDRAFSEDWQLLVHANGDAAIDQMIRLVRAAAAKHPGTDRRPVLIHGQYLRRDQIPELVELGIFPALFPMHTFYWGDWHRSSVAGPERATFISPTAAVQQAGLHFTIHSDAPVTFPNSMRLLHSAVNRTTRSGVVLGPDQRIDVTTALKAMTLWAAEQHFEEDRKGSLEVGKLADLVVLSGNPLTTAPEDLMSLRVLETVKAGEEVYAAAP